jgi:hypothetical protein
MRDKPTYHWIITVIGGAMLGAILWFVLNILIEDFGGEWLDHGDWPLANPYLLFAVFGACIAVVMEVRRTRRERRRAGRLAAFAEDLSLDYSWEIAESDYSAWSDLPIIQKKWFSARNRLYGTVDDVPVEMLDFEYVVEGSGDAGIDGAHGPVGGSQDKYRDQTIVLLPAGERELPSFLLLARSFHTWLAGMVGQEGFRFSIKGIFRHDAADVKRFEKAYVLVANADMDSGKTGSELPICQLFSLRAIRFLADHPGWTVECVGRQMAFYKSRKIIPVASRRHFLEEALVLRATLVDPQDEASAVMPVADTSSTSESVSDRMMSTIVGAFCGFFLGAMFGFILAGLTISHFSDRPSNILFTFFLGAVPFFGSALGGLVLGAIIGRWGLAGFIASTRRKR